MSEQTDPDLLEDLLLPEEGEEDGITIDPKKIEKMEEELKAKEKQIAGLLNEVKTDRKKRQEYKGQLDAVTETINAMLTQREQQLAELEKAGSDDRIEVDITDDGDAFIPRNKLDELVAPFQQRIDALEAQLNDTNQRQASAQDSEQLIRSLVGEDERYGPVYNKYQAARKWVNDKVIDFQRENNIRGQLKSGEALTHVFNESDAEAFEKEFGMDLATVTTAEDSTWHFKKMLSETAEAFDAIKKPDDRFRQVVNKPSTLGKSSNAKAGELSLTDRVSNMSSLDIMGLTDAQAEALQKFIADDEQKGGIKF